MSKEQPPPRSHSIRRKVLGTTAAVGAASLFTQCIALAPRPTTITTGWTTIAAVDNSSRNALEDYKAAYIAFEKATDEALIEARQQKDKMFDAVLGGKINIMKGVNFVFRANAINGSAGECYLVSKSAPEEKLASFPKVVAMFDAYRELCRQQNNLPAELASNANLSSAPDESNFNDFLITRILQLPSDSALSKSNIDFIASWVAKPFLAIKKFNHADPMFKSPDASYGDFALLKTLLETERAWSISEFTHTFGMMDSESTSKHFDIPSPEQILELKRHFAEGTFGRKVADQLEAVKPLCTIRSEDDDHTITVLKLMEIPVTIRIENPYYGRQRPNPAYAFSMAR